MIPPMGTKNSKLWAYGKPFSSSYHILLYAPPGSWPTIKVPIVCHSVSTDWETKVADSGNFLIMTSYKVKKQNTHFQRSMAQIVPFQMGGIRAS